jgi:hypothetical protein
VGRYRRERLWRGRSEGIHWPQDAQKAQKAQKRRGMPEGDGQEDGFHPSKMGTKTVGTVAVDYDTVVARRAPLLCRNTYAWERIGRLPKVAPKGRAERGERVNKVASNGMDKKAEGKVEGRRSSVEAITGRASYFERWGN